MAMTEYGDISPRTAAWASRELLKRGQPYLVLEKFGQSRPVPKGKSNVAKFRQYSALALATTPVTEGVTPTAKQLSSVDKTATLAQYGDLVTITDVVQDTHEDPVLEEAAAVLGEQAAQTVEDIRFGIVKAGTNIVYANGAARSAVNTAYTKTMQRLAVRTLKGQNAKPITKVLKSSVKYDTHAVAPSYIGLIHPDMESTIRDFAGFVPAESYGSMTPFENELGKVEDVRYLSSTVFAPWADAGGTKGTMISTTGTDADVYPVLIVGRDAYGIVPLKGAGSLTPSVINLAPSKSDPLGQRGHVSWKTMQTCVRLNEAWMVRVEAAVVA